MLPRRATHELPRGRGLPHAATWLADVAACVEEAPNMQMRSSMSSPHISSAARGVKGHVNTRARASLTHTHTHPIVCNSLFSGHMFIISFIHFIHFYTLNVHFVSYKNLDLTKQHTFKTHRCIVFFILCLLPACMRLIFWNSLLSRAASALSSHAEGCLTKQESGLPRSEGSSVWAGVDELTWMNF